MLLIKDQAMSTQSSRLFGTPDRDAPGRAGFLKLVYCSAFFASSAVGKRERMLKYRSSRISLVFLPDAQSGFSFGPWSILRWMLLEFRRYRAWAGSGLWSRSFSIPVARAGRPNKAR